MLQLLKPARLEPVLHNKRSHHNKKPAHCNEDPTQPNKINKFIKKKKTFLVYFLRDRLYTRHRAYCRG